MRRAHPRTLSFQGTVALAVAAAGVAALIAGCGSISVVSDGGNNNNSGSGGNIDIITGSGGTTAGAGGSVAGSGGATGQGGTMAGTGGERTGTGGAMTGSGGSEGMGGSGGGAVGGAPGTGGRMGDAGVDSGVVACTAVRGCCSTDSDCNLNQECAGMACGADGRASGVCKARPNRNSGRCWTDADCANQNNNNTCTGAVICPCGMVCPRVDIIGMCN